MKFNYCPDCGAKASVARQNATDYECTACSWHFWNNAKATATTVFINPDGHILYVLRAIDPQKGFYGLPGGFIEYNEDPYKAAAREALEETGVRVKNPQLLDVHYNEYMPDYISTCDLYFVATEWEGQPVAGDDAAEVAWRPVDILGSDQFAWPYGPKLMARIQTFIATMKDNANLPAN